MYNRQLPGAGRRLSGFEGDEHDFAPGEVYVLVVKSEKRRPPGAEWAGALVQCKPYPQNPRGIVACANREQARAEQLRAWPHLGKLPAIEAIETLTVVDFAKAIGCPLYLRRADGSVMHVQLAGDPVVGASD